jgi:hypothetical protein
MFTVTKKAAVRWKVVGFGVLGVLTIMTALFYWITLDLKEIFSDCFNPQKSCIFSGDSGD